MVITKEQRKKNLAEAIKNKKIEQAKLAKKNKRNKNRAPIPQGEKDYKWCDSPSAPTIEVGFDDNMNIVEEYTNGKRVKWAIKLNNHTKPNLRGKKN